MARWSIPTTSMSRLGILPFVDLESDSRETSSTAKSAKAAEQKLQNDKSADPAALRAAHEAFIAADTKVRDLEEKAVLADPKVNELRRRVDAAQEPLVQMRDKFEQDLEKEPSFATVLDDMQQQQAALDAALADQKKLDAQIASLQGGKPDQLPHGGLRAVNCPAAFKRLL